MKDLFNDLYQNGYRLIEVLISLFARIMTAALAGMIYFFIQKIFPPSGVSVSFVPVSVAVISVLAVLLPVQEYVENLLKKHLLSEYFAYEGPIKGFYRDFDYDTLVRFVFSDMIEVSGNETGRMIILDKNEIYMTYFYSGGKAKTIKSYTLDMTKEVLESLKSAKTGISLSEADEKNFPKEVFSYLKAGFILPFLFREKIFGILSLVNVPDREMRENLTVLASKSALAVHNHLLSSQIAVHQKVKQEFDFASRVEENIFTARLPVSQKFHFELLSNTAGCLLESIEFLDKHRIFILLSLEGNKRFGASLVLSHILGKIIGSGFKNDRAFPHKIIKNFIEHELGVAGWNDGYDLMIIGFSEASHDMVFSRIGGRFRVMEGSPPRLIPVRWRKLLTAGTEPITVFRGIQPLVRITAEAGKES